MNESEKSLSLSYKVIESFSSASVDLISFLLT